MYVLPESLTIRNVKSVQGELIYFLKQVSAIDEYETKETVLDFSHLKNLDTAGLQLLLSAAISFRKEGVLKVINVQVPMQELLQLTGAGDILTSE